jgi:hypothetical protein
MHPRAVPLLVVAILVLAFGAIVAACDSDGGGSLTLDEYFRTLEQLDQDKDDRNTELEEQFDTDVAAVDSEEEALDVSREFLGAGVSNLKDFVDGLDDINPPAEVEEAHNMAVDAGRKAVEAAEGAVKVLDDAESAADLEAAFSGDLEEAGREFEETCVNLQAIADENKIEVDLDCKD